MLAELAAAQEERRAEEARAEQRKMEAFELILKRSVQQHDAASATGMSAAAAPDGAGVAGSAAAGVSGEGADGGGLYAELADLRLSPELLEQAKQELDMDKEAVQQALAKAKEESRAEAAAAAAAAAEGQWEMVGEAPEARPRGQQQQQRGAEGWGGRGGRGSRGWGRGSARGHFAVRAAREPPHSEGQQGHADAGEVEAETWFPAGDAVVAVTATGPSDGTATGGSSEAGKSAKPVPTVLHQRRAGRGLRPHGGHGPAAVEGAAGGQAGGDAQAAAVSPAVPVPASAATASLYFTTNRAVEARRVVQEVTAAAPQGRPQEHPIGPRSRVRTVVVPPTPPAAAEPAGIASSYSPANDIAAGTGEAPPRGSMAHGGRGGRRDGYGGRGAGPGHGHGPGRGGPPPGAAVSGTQQLAGAHPAQLPQQKVPTAGVAAAKAAAAAALVGASPSANGIPSAEGKGPRQPARGGVSGRGGGRSSHGGRRGGRMVGLGGRPPQGPPSAPQARE